MQPLFPLPHPAVPSKPPVAEHPEAPMANFPFDLTALLPPGQQALEVPRRPARIRVLSAASAPVHEEWAIATFVPMPNLPAHFNNVRDLLGEFLQHVRHIAFSEISPRPLVKLMLG